MLKEGQKIEIKWNPADYGYLRKLGYEFKKGESIFVSPEELSEGSHKRVEVICDSCGREVGMEYRQYFNKSNHFHGKYYCKKCAGAVEEVVEQRKITCLEKYGTENPMQVKEIQQKVNESLCKNGNVPTSSQQLAIYNFLKEQFEDCGLNENFGPFALDCTVKVNGIKIDVEYDGWYWHQNESKDKGRDKYLFHRGWKILRIKGGNKYPNNQEVLEKVNQLINEDMNYVEIILEDYKKQKKEKRNT